MGVTQISVNRITPFLKTGMRMLELGAQNMYDNSHYGWIAKDYFEIIFIEHVSIDLIQHQKCEYADLRESLPYVNFDIVTNFGTCEHVDGSLYQPLLNIHNACNIGGIMIHENPASGSWPLHGHHYFSEEFWYNIAESCGYIILEITTEASMGNYIDGWNISCILKKKSNENFISEDQFNEIYSKYITSK